MSYFTSKTFEFLNNLQRHNDHAWFRDHKKDYENYVREPALSFIRDCQPLLQTVSLHYRAEAKKVGGSLFRVMKDTRFEHPNGPYKPWVGMRFYHERARDVHSPGFYVHIDPEAENCFFSAGIWKPESRTLKQIRQFILDNPNGWEKAKRQAESHGYYLSRENTLQTYPRGFDPQHRLIDDLKLKGFSFYKPISQRDVLSESFLQKTGEHFKHMGAMVDYLCAALDLDF